MEILKKKSKIRKLHIPSQFVAHYTIGRKNYIFFNTTTNFLQRLLKVAFHKTISCKISAMLNLSYPNHVDYLKRSYVNLCNYITKMCHKIWKTAE